MENDELNTRMRDALVGQFTVHERRRVLKSFLPLLIKNALELKLRLDELDRGLQPLASDSALRKEELSEMTRRWLSRPFLEALDSLLGTEDFDVHREVDDVLR